MSKIGFVKTVLSRSFFISVLFISIVQISCKNDQVSNVYERSNIVLIYTDDESSHEAKVVQQTMPSLYKNIISKATSYSNYICSSPFCAPSRASLLTGLMPSKTGHNNNDGDALVFFDKFKDANLGKLMQNEGYYTVFVGKYFNPLRSTTKLNGWDDMQITSGGYFEFNKRKSKFSFPVQRSDRETRVEFETELIVQVLDNYHAKKNKKPIFLYYAPFAPHGAKFKRDVEEFNKIENITEVKNLITTPDREDEQMGPNRLLRKNNKSVEDIEKEVHLRLKRLAQLDSGLNLIWDKMKELHVFDKSYIFYTSDNGFHLGERNLWGKRSPYIESVKVPFYVKEPSMSTANINDRLISTIDLLPTFLNIANRKKESYNKGISIFSDTEQEFVFSELINGLNRSNELNWTLGANKEGTIIKFEDDTYEFYDNLKDRNQNVNVFDPIKHNTFVDQILTYEKQRLKFLK